MTNALKKACIVMACVALVAAMVLVVLRWRNRRQNPAIRADNASTNGARIDFVREGRALRWSDPKRALELFDRGCDAGVARACTEAGFALMRTHAVADGFARFQRGCALKDEKGCARVAYGMIWGDTGKSPDLAGALPIAQHACDANEPEGCFALGTLATFIVPGMSKTDPVPLVARACDGGSVGACGNLARWYRQGEYGLTTDGAKALALYERGCNDQEIELCVDVLAMHTTAELRDGPKAIAAGTRGCDGNEGEACAALGALHQGGVLAPKDDAKALSLYKKANGLGSVLSYGSLSNAYMIGLAGIAVDDKKARELAEKGCTLGEGGSCNNLGVLYYSGRGGLPVDPTEAVMLFGKACDAQLAEGCRALAEEYDKGLVVPRDAHSATEYFRQACALGDAASCEKKVKP